MSLADQVITPSLWPTPMVPNGGRVMKPEDVLNKGNTEKGKRQVGLESAVKLWPTPTVQDGKNNAGPSQYERNSYPLNVAVALYPTPDVGAAKGRGMASAEERSRLGGSLSPNFVEWLMMFPKDWTKIERSSGKSGKGCPGSAPGSGTGASV